MILHLRDITHQVIEHYKSQTGKGPRTIRINIMDHVMIINASGILTTLERNLIQHSDSNKDLVNSIRSQLIEQGIKTFVSYLKEKLNQDRLAFKNYGTAIDFDNDIQIITLIFNSKLQINEYKKEHLA